ncbi:SDR family oxidoreductase [Nocardioides rubriscoriae]|uniref:SDR family oxidoreductase n=1 Tax=Nocardioides rubriscoriae TaxID=642762 RepID=UPI0011DFA26F|nr:SDR family oxidoreductase [Nocardioides rubriscoriae]
MSQVLVIGAHGKVALLAEELLVQAGHQVTGMIRKPEQADDVRATGAEPVVADIVSIEDDALATLLAEHDVVVWSAGAGGGSAERTYAIDRDAAIRTIDAAQAAGGTHVVMVSYFGAGPDHGVSPDHDFFAYADAKSAADAHLQASSTPWTLLRPSSLTDGPATGVATSDTESREVSRATVAQVVATVVDAGEAAVGRVITFNGGDQDVATVVS